MSGGGGPKGEDTPTPAPPHGEGFAAGQGETAPRLALKTLGELPADVARPGYDVGAAEVGVVHLGVGAFHRAHQAVYLDDVMARGAKGLGDRRREPARGRHV